MEELYECWNAIGKKVIKVTTKGGKLKELVQSKVFKSGNTANTVKGIVKHATLGIPAFIFEEDDSQVECRRCRVVGTETENEATAWVERINVSCLDRNEREWRHCHVTVEHRGTTGWAVVNAFGECLGRYGPWHDEPIPSERSDKWIKQHRFEFSKAMELAKKEAEKMFTEWKEINEKR